MLATAAFSQVQTAQDIYYADSGTVTEKANQPPPALPDYTQPPCPVEGYIWEPGYWGWGSDGYFWVPGVWVSPPQPGLYWTPGYWGWYGGYYGFHHGYWGPSIGYYGGINYGFGYFGTGFYGGRWDGGVFRYNAAVWHVGHGFHNVYRSEEGINHVAGVRASFNGPNGVHYRPSGGEVNVMHANHVARTNEQVAHHAAAANDRALHVNASHPAPAYHSMSQPGGQRFNAGGHAYGGGGGHGGGGHGGGGRR